MNNKINGCVHRFDAEAGVLLPISKKKTSKTDKTNVFTEYHTKAT
jgi:hypothetical protein